MYPKVLRELTDCTLVYAWVFHVPAVQVNVPLQTTVLKVSPHTGPHTNFSHCFRKQKAGIYQSGHDQSQEVSRSHCVEGFQGFHAHLWVDVIKKPFQRATVDLQWSCRCLLQVVFLAASNNTMHVIIIGYQDPMTATCHHMQFLDRETSNSHSATDFSDTPQKGLANDKQLIRER